MENPIILYRNISGLRVFDSGELQAMQKHFRCTDSRIDISSGDLVIPRYSALPFYEELEKDINKSGARLINTFRQHRYVADLQNWYNDLQDITPKTWFRSYDVPKNEGPFVLKGETNSRKFLWNTHMFAETWEDMVKVSCNLNDDTMIGQQSVYVRKFVPLKTYFKSFNNLPISKEFRFFIAFKKVLCGAFYWSNSVEDIPVVPSIDEVPKAFLQKVLDAVDDKINFYVVDVAETETGDWIVIELNDGSQSGLSENDPDVLYATLKKVIGENSG